MSSTVLYTSRDQELCENWGGRPGLSVLMSLTVSVDVKQHWTMLRHWSQFVPNMSADIRGHEALLHQHLCPTKAMDRRSRQARKERTVAVAAHWVRIRTFTVRVEVYKEMCLTVRRTEDHISDWVTKDRILEWVTKDHISEWVTKDHISEWVTKDRILEWMTKDHIIFRMSDEGPYFRVGRERNRIQ